MSYFCIKCLLILLLNQYKSFFLECWYLYILFTDYHIFISLSCQTYVLYAVPILNDQTIFFFHYSIFLCWMTKLYNLDRKILSNKQINYPVTSKDLDFQRRMLRSFCAQWAKVRCDCSFYEIDDRRCLNFLFIIISNASI